MSYREATQMEAEEFCSNSPGCPVMFIREDDPYLLRRRDDDDTPDIDAIERAIKAADAVGDLMPATPKELLALVRQVRELKAALEKEKRRVCTDPHWEA